MNGKVLVMLLGCKALLLGGGGDLSVNQKGRGAVVIKGGDAEDVHNRTCPITMLQELCSKG